MNSDQFDLTHWVGHSASLLAIIAAFAGWLPAIAALAGFVWYVIQIWESKTVKDYLRKRKRRKVAALKRKVEYLTSKLSD